MPSTDDLSWLSDDEHTRLDSCVQTFELAWRENETGQTVELEPFLPGEGDRLRRLVLHRLMAADLAARWQRGQRTLLEHYLREFPELGTPAELPVALIHEEYRIRARHGPAPALGDYENRFPDQFARLRRLIEPASNASSKPAPPPPSGPSGSALAIQPGAIVGSGYRLVNRLGRGAFGEVWKAEAPGGVEVAVKIIIRSLTEKEAQGERNALELTKRLRHGYLLQTHQFWALEDRLLIVMELADGSLRDRFRECLAQGQSGIPVDELLLYLEQSAQALDYLHENRLLHRDIKPENILRIGKLAKLADFGLAMVLPETVRSVTVNSAGTIPYMAPEIWYGKACEASDQWSLGISYVELRLGRLLFGAGNQAEMMFAILNNAPDLAGLHPAEQEVLRQALAKEHANRFATCSEFTDALRGALTPVLPVRKTSGVRQRVVQLVAPSKAAPTPPPDLAQPPAPGPRTDPDLVRRTVSAVETTQSGLVLNPPERARAEGEFGTMVIRPENRPAGPKPAAGARIAAPAAASASPRPFIAARPRPNKERGKLLLLVGALAGGVAIALGLLVWAAAHRPPADSTEQLAAMTGAPTAPNAVPLAASPERGPSTTRDGGDNGPPVPHAVADFSNRELIDALDTVGKADAQRADDLVKQVVQRFDGPSTDKRLKPDEAETAADKLDRAGLAPALRPYADYLRAALLEKKDKVEAANRIDKVLSAATWPALLSDAERQRRIGRIVLAPVQPLRERGTYDHPFGEAADAEQAYRWLGPARRLVTSGPNEAPPALRLTLLLAAWSRPTRTPTDDQLILELAKPLLAARDKLQPAELCSLLLARASALGRQAGAAARPALNDYEEALVLTRQLEQGDPDTAAKAVVDAVLAPAFQLGERLLKDGGDANLKRQVAALAAAEARRITDHRYAPWSFKDQAGQPVTPGRQAFDLYDRAIALDNTRSSYFFGRGSVRARLPSADLDLVAKDAATAQQLDSKNPGGYFLAGYVAHLRARAASDATKRWALLIKGLAACTEAQTKDRDLPPGKDRLTGSLLVERSNICLELGNYASDPDLRKKYLCQARAEAVLATTAEGQRYPDEASAALGSAEEDIAWLLGATSHYKAALEAFTRAADIPDERTQARRLIDLGRARYRWNKYGGGDKDLLDKAELDIKGSLRRQADPLTYAKAHDWLGLIALERGNTAGAEGEFRQAADNLRDPKGPVVEAARYAAEWVSQRRHEFDSYPPPPQAGKALAKAIRDRLRPGTTDSDRVQEALDRAWSFELENKPAEALARYIDSLPGDLARAKSTDLPLILACGYLLMARPADLEKEKKPELESLAKAALAVTSGDADASDRRNAAIGFVGVVDHQLVISNAGPREKLQAWHKESKDDLRRAVAAAPNDPNCPMWRVALVAELATDVLFDPNLGDAEKTKMRTEIAEQIDHAERAGWQRLDKLIQELRDQLKMKKDAKPKTGSGAGVDC